MEDLTQEGMMKLQALKATYNSVEKHSADINNNEKFEWPVTEPAWRRDPLPPGVKYVTNCRKCAKTCHSDCTVEDRALCCMFHHGPWSPFCKACRERNGTDCLASDHHNDDHIFVFYTKTIMQSNSTMKEKYNIAKGDKDAAQKILDGLADD